MSTPVKKKRGVGLGLSITRSLSMTSNATRLLPYLVLGGQEVVSDSAMLELFSVTHILNASTEISCAFEDRLSYLRVPVEDKPEADVKQHFGAIRAFLADVKERHLRGEKSCCFVHCKTGMSRSTTSVLAFLISEPGMLREVAAFTSRAHLLRADGKGSASAAAQPAGSDPAAAAAALATSAAPVSELSELDGEASPFMRLRDALAYVRERRPRASPNQGFMAQLLELEASLHADGVSIDIGKYSADRFGDIRACCNGAIHPAVGYTGGAATAGFSAAEDAMLLQTQVQAVVEASPMPDAATSGAGMVMPQSAVRVPSLKGDDLAIGGPESASDASSSVSVAAAGAASAVPAPSALHVPAAAPDFERMAVVQTENQAREPPSSGSASGAAFAGFAGADAPVSAADMGSQHLDRIEAAAPHGADSGFVGVCGRGAATTVPASRDDHGISDASLSAILPQAAAPGKPVLSSGSLHARGGPFAPGLRPSDSRNGLGGAPLLASLPPSFAGGSLMLHFGASQLQPLAAPPQHASAASHDNHYSTASSSAGFGPRPQAGTRARSRSRSQVRSASGAVQARRASITSPGGSGAAAQADHTGAYGSGSSGKLSFAGGHSDTGTPQAASPGVAFPSSPASARGSIGGSSTAVSNVVLSASGSRATTLTVPAAFTPDADSPPLPILCVHGVGSPPSQRRSSFSSSSGYRGPAGRPALASPGSLVAPSFSAGPAGVGGYGYGGMAFSPGSSSSCGSGAGSGTCSAEPFGLEGSLSVTGSAVPLQALQQQKPSTAAAATFGSVSGPVGVLLVPHQSASGTGAAAGDGRKR